MRSTEDVQRLSVVDRSLVGLFATGSTLFLIFWMQPDEVHLRGWLSGVLSQDSGRISGELTRVALELVLLVITIGLGASVVLRFLSTRRRETDRTDDSEDGSPIRCAEVGYSTRIDLVARTIATLSLEEPFTHLSIIGDRDGRCGLQWNVTPLFEAPPGWTVESTTIWFLDHAATFDTGDFPFPVLVCVGSSDSGREYFVDIATIGGVGFVGAGSSLARDVLRERWNASPWNRLRSATGAPEIDAYLVDEVSDDFAGLIFDISADGIQSTWSPRGRPWQVHHPLPGNDDLCGNKHLPDGGVTSVATKDDQLADTSSDEFVDEQSGGYSFLVRVLGEVVVQTADGHAVVFERGRSQELLAWLVTHRERPTRSSARSAIWDAAVRPTTFANVVSDIRRTLTRAVEEETSSDWIQRDTGDDLVIDDRIVSDAALLDHAVRRSRGLSPEEVISCLHWPVSLLRGLPFQGTVYRWPDPEGLTSELVMLSISATTALAQAYLELADLEGVMWATGQGLRVLPGDEELIALRMRARGRQGDVAALRQEWDSYERVLTDEWSGGTPSPVLRNLRRELLEDRSR